MNLPPRMVSRKWTCQLSLLLTLPMEAAMPPSAMTVCALPNSDLQMIAVRRPASCASIAARSPAPPAPMTMTSKSVTLVLAHAFCSYRRARSSRQAAQLKKRKSVIQPAETAMT